MRTTEFDFAGAEKQAKTAKRQRKVVIASVVGAAILIPGAAWAAVTLFGIGSFAADSTVTTGEITILTGADTPTQVTPALAPGQSAGVKIPVRNNNSYPVKVTGVIVKNGSLTYTNGTAGQCDIAVNGTAATFPANKDGGNGGGGKLTSLAAADTVTLNPGDQTYVTFPNVFTQQASATKICGVGAEFAVTGIAGS